MKSQVVITGMGIVSPLGYRPKEVLSRILDGERALSTPSFDVAPFDCRVCTAVADFDAEQHFPDNKTLRMMNRDAQMAVVAADLAVKDAGVVVDETYASEDIGLYGSTGLTGLPVDEIRRLVQFSAAADGSLDLQQFGQVALRRVRPVLSFKILANIPICFVSIFEGIRGENAVYTPWEHHGAQAVIAGIRATPAAPGKLRRLSADAMSRHTSSPSLRCSSKGTSSPGNAPGAGLPTRPKRWHGAGRRGCVSGVGKRGGCATPQRPNLRSHPRP